MQIYAPDVKDDNGQEQHFYCVAKPDSNPQISHKLFDITSQTNSFSGLTGAVPPPPPPAFDPAFSLVLPNFTPPTTFRYVVTIPYPDDIALGQDAIQKIPGKRIFANTQINGNIQVPDFQMFAREHIFIYDAGHFDPQMLAFNGQPIQFLPTEAFAVRILSEPLNDNTTAQQCVNHQEFAMRALARMLGLKDDDLNLTVDYCSQFVTSLASLRARRTKKNQDGPGGTRASRVPACNSVIVNNT